MAFTTPRAFALLCALCASLQAQFLTTGIESITLSMSGVAGSTPMNIAWHPDFQQYYGGRGGNSSYGGRVWSASGSIVQTLEPINTDLRSFFHNSNTGNLENITYAANVSSAGYRTVGLDSSGRFTGAYTDAGVVLSGLPSNQVAPAYDAARNLFYAYDSGGTVKTVNPATGAVIGTITLDLTAAGSTNIPYHVIGYEPTYDALITYTTTGGARALAFNPTTGAFITSVSLPGTVPSPDYWRMGYANHLLFVYDSNIDAFRGYQITTIPEPGTVALLALGVTLLGIGHYRRRRR